jgi:DNA polymerase-1
MTPDEPSRLPPAGDPRTLYVVDISGYLFRAYHALPPLSSPHGEPTGAVLGVTTMLQKLVQERRPAMLAVAMDSRTPSFREARYPEYKAHRPPVPPELRQQMARVRDVIDAYRLPVFQQDGVEADDVIATLVKQARAEGLSTVIVSSDKDLMQLVGDGVLMLDTMRDVVIGPREVQAKLGVPPAQVRDYLALVGDSSDNVPGVPSVGPKTAAELLSAHGDLDRLYGALDRVERKTLRQKLTDHREQAYLSRELVTLKDDLDLGIDPAALPRPAPDVERLRALFSELGFTRLVAQLGAPSGPTVAASAPSAVGAAEAGASEAATAPATAAPDPCELIASEPALQALAVDLQGADCIALLCLMEGAHPVSGALVGLTFAFGARNAYIPVGHSYLGCPAQLDAAEVLRVLAGVLGGERPAKICADAKREIMVLRSSGAALAGVVFDCMLASYLIDPEGHGHRLDEVARFELDQLVEAADKPLLEHRLEQGTLSGEPVEQLAARAAKLARLTLAAHGVLAPKLDAVGCAALLRDMELPLARVLADMELTGVRVDTTRLARLSHTVAEQLIVLEQRCKQLAGHDFNVGSPRQLETILFDELKLPVTKRTKTARSTDHSVLEDLALLHDLPAAILEHRMLAKLKGTYLDALPREVNPRSGRIHTDFRQAVAATGRLSSSDPNLQNIPIRSEIGRSIREAFVARDGWQVLSADYSQIELRVLAHLSRDAELMDAFSRGADVHTRTARAIFGVEEDKVTREMRGQAKTVNFAVIYGQTQFALARNLRIERGQAARYIAAFFEQYAGVAAYMESVVAEATKSGEVRTLCGRIRKLPDLRSQNRVQRQAAERVARNTPIQGSAADIIKLAMIAIARELEQRKLQSKMLLSVHDELVFEAPSEEREQLEQLVCDRMEHVVALDVPLVADKGWGESWGKAH